LQIGVRTGPFRTYRRLVYSGARFRPALVKIDPGSKTTGIAVVAGEDGTKFAACLNSRIGTVDQRSSDGSPDAGFSDVC
jgi:hypothetical protein